jgi:hypothetical protein
MKTLSVAQFFFFSSQFLNSNEFFSLKEITLKNQKKFKFISKSTSQNDKSYAQKIK